MKQNYAAKGNIKSNYNNQSLQSHSFSYALIFFVFMPISFFESACRFSTSEKIVENIQKSFSQYSTTMTVFAIKNMNCCVFSLLLITLEKIRHLFHVVMKLRLIDIKTRCHLIIGERKNRVILKERCKIVIHHHQTIFKKRNYHKFVHSWHFSYFQINYNVEI